MSANGGYSNINNFLKDALVSKATGANINLPLTHTRFGQDDIHARAGSYAIKSTSDDYWEPDNIFGIF